MRREARHALRYFTACMKATLIFRHEAYIQAPLLLLHVFAAFSVSRHFSLFIYICSSIYHTAYMFSEKE
jgi:hypothetical protein